MSDRIWIWFADNGNIRKWQHEPFPEGTEYVVAAQADAELEEMTRSCLAERAGAASLRSKLEEAEGALELARDESVKLKDYAHKATATITELHGGGSECFAGKIGDMYVADLDFCKQRIQERNRMAHERLLLARTRKDETAWLIELRGKAPMWWSIVGEPDWTGNSLDALRFARKADADAYIADIGWTEAFASEHVWVAPRRALASLREADHAGL